MLLRVLLAVVAVGCAGLLVVLGASAEIVKHDAALHYTDDRFWRVRFFAGLELHVSKMTRPHLEAVISMILFLLGGAAIVSALLLERLEVPGQGQLLAFFVVVAAGALVLAVDELIELNETIAANLPLLDRAPFPGRGNMDAITYPPGVLVFLAIFWRTLRSSRRAFRLWIASLALFAVTSVMDVVGGLSMLEVTGELIVATGITAGFVVLAVDRLVPLLAARSDAVAA